MALAVAPADGPGVALLNIAAIVYAPAADGPGVARLNIAAIVYAPAADGPGVALLLPWRW